MPKTQRVSPPGTRTRILSLSEKQREGRAVNAVAEMMMRNLLVPKIFLEPKGPKIFVKPKLVNTNTTFADLLAIDRAGSGDVHAVEIFFSQFKDPHVTKDFLEKLLPRAIQRVLEFRPVHFFI